MSPLLKKKTAINPIVKYCIESGIMAFCIMMFTYLCHSNTLTGGENTVLRMDLYHQYGPLYSELYDRITQGGSLVYSWTSGLGGGFLGNFFNYCCSPFAFVMLIFGHKNMPEAIAVMILLKAVVSSVTFTYYINKTNGNTSKLSPAFGVLYAFCGYFVAYSWNIMWLDAMAIFPLVILGIEKIINERKPVLFIVSLTLTMITNYYMAYMVCILSVIYFLYYFFGHYSASDSFPSNKKVKTANPRLLEPEEADDFSDSLPGENKKAKKKKNKTSFWNSRFYHTGVVFAGSAILSFLLAAFALIPVVYSLQSSSATSSTFPDKIRVYFNFFDFVANHLPAVNTTIRSSGDIVLPNVYCGILSILLVPFYFMSSKISGKQKVAAFVVLGLFYLSFSINYLNYIWHGFHFPNDLPYRYSFAYSFILLTLVYKVLLNAEEFSKKDYVTAGVALVAFVFIVEKIGSLNINDKTIYLSLIFAVFYIIVFGLMKSPRYNSKTISTLLVFLIITEICFCNTGNYVMSQSKKNYTYDYDSYQQISSAVESSDDELFYRTELSKLRARMDPCWFGYNGVSTFSSMAYENTSGLMKSLGLFGNKINSYTYYPQTPVFNSFFSLKYIYDNNDYLSDNAYYSLVGANDVYDAYRFKYVLPIAFSVDSGIKNWDTSSVNPFIVQNLLMESSTGIKDVLTPVKATNIEVSNLTPISVDSVNNGTSFFVDKVNKTAEATATVIIDVAEAGDYYVYAGSTKLSRLKINAEDFSFDYISSSIQPITMGVGYQPAGAQIKIEYTVDKANASGSLTFCAAKTDDALFKNAYDKINANGTLVLSSFAESSFEGTINVTNDNAFIFTSIPYDQSWEIMVDGKKLSYYNAELDNTTNGKIVAVGGGLIGFDIEKGEHTVRFQYVPRGLSYGILLSIIGILIAVILITVVLLKKKKNPMPMNGLSDTGADLTADAVSIDEGEQPEEQYDSVLPDNESSAISECNYLVPPEPEKTVEIKSSDDNDDLNQDHPCC